MLGPIITAGIGALTFKLGMDAQRMRDAGQSASEIAQNLVTSTGESICEAARYCYDQVSGLLCCCEEPTKRSHTRKSASKSKPRRRADGRFC